ncbi:phage tail protein [Bosea vestrisii]|uniref:Phage tail protein n=1 Tax=Bosea vestrisii TaxID=151416 RepID=A0ABW0H764_9HYPH
MIERYDNRLIPPSVNDDRGQAFGETLRQALADPDFRALLMERIDDVDARLLPFLIREFGLQHFVEPGMTEAVIRRLLKGSFQLHAQMGYIYGVRTGLAMLGIGITSWSQWFQQLPQGAPGTHRATLSIADEVFAGEGRAITARLQRAIERMVLRMKRFSQHVAIRFVAGGGQPGSDNHSTPVHVAALVITRLRVAPSTAPITTLFARPALFAGAAVSTRLRIAPRIP